MNKSNDTLVSASETAGVINFTCWVSFVTGLKKTSNNMLVCAHCLLKVSININEFKCTAEVF